MSTTDPLLTLAVIQIVPSGLRSVSAVERVAFVTARFSRWPVFAENVTRAICPTRASVSGSALPSTTIVPLTSSDRVSVMLRGSA